MMLATFRFLSVLVLGVGLSSCATQSPKKPQPSMARYSAPGYPTPAPRPASAPAYSQPQHVAPRQFTMDPRAPLIHAESYLLLDATTGRVFSAKNATSSRGVASTQKLLTALLVVESGDLDRSVTVQASDVMVEPTKLGIRPGEVYTRRQLVTALLVKSCNDVANVLARDNAGSVSAFTAKMNQRARSLGAVNSYFKNPHGLTAAGQYSSAHDIGRVAMAAYRNPIIRDIVRRRSYAFRFNSGRVVVLENTNKILPRMAACNGMKTGYTVAAGRCLISSAHHQGRHVILVQLGTKTKYIWDDGMTLMTWGLNQR